MNLLSTYLSKPSTQRVLSKKPGQEGFSLIELVVVIAVLAVLTAIALPNFLGVSDDAAARSAQQSAITAFKECQVRKARGETTGTFAQADSTDFYVSEVASTVAVTDGTSSVTTSSKDCFTLNALNNFVAVPKTPFKFPKFMVAATGIKTCVSGNPTAGPTTATVGCDGAAGTSAYGSPAGNWR